MKNPSESSLRFSSEATFSKSISDFLRVRLLNSKIRFSSSTRYQSSSSFRILRILKSAPRIFGSQFFLNFKFPIQICFSKSGAFINSATKGEKKSNCILLSVKKMSFSMKFLKDRMKDSSAKIRLFFGSLKMVWIFFMKIGASSKRVLKEEQ